MTDFLLMVGGAFFAMFVSGIVNYGKREWVGLTDEEIDEIIENSIDKVDALIQTMDKLKEKNT
jgi:hypothetical protein